MNRRCLANGSRIKDFLAGTKDPDLLRFFTERRLRTLTMMSDAEAQMTQFAELLAEAKEGTSGSGDILWSPTETRARVPAKDSGN